MSESKLKTVKDNASVELSSGRTQAQAPVNAPLENSWRTRLVGLLTAVGLIKPARKVYFYLLRKIQQRAYHRLIKAYWLKHEPMESFAAWEAEKLQNEEDQYRTTFFKDLRRLVRETMKPEEVWIPEILSQDDATLSEEFLKECGRAMETLKKEDPRRQFLAFVQSRFQSGQSAGAVPAALPKDFQKRMLQFVLDTVVDEEVVPIFSHVDRLKDLEHIVGSRYQCAHPEYRSRTQLFTEILQYLSGTQEGFAGIQKAVPAILGPDNRFSNHIQQKGGDREEREKIAYENVRKPVAVNAVGNYDQYLENNRQYSLVQRKEAGAFDTRELSLLREYENDHFAMFRTLIKLLRDKKIRKDDPVLVVGPRHRTEMSFFQKDLGLKNTVGLDLFEDRKARIHKGDMHHMQFADNTFKLVYICNCLGYSYYARIVIEEIARVCKRPGYVFVIDHAGFKQKLPTLVLQDICRLKNAETIRRLFYRHKFKTLVKDNGRSLDPGTYFYSPCVAVELQ